MKAVILAAGNGGRMFPFSPSIPKVMIPIANKPFLHHIIDALKQAGIINIVLVVNYQHDPIKNYFGYGTQFGVNIEYVWQTEMLGTAHAISMAARKIKSRFLVLNGDCYIDPHHIKRAMRSDHDVVMTATELADPDQYGVMEVEDGYVTALHEKTENPPTNLVNTGVYVFNPDVFDFIRTTPKSTRGEYEITQTIQDMMDYGLKVEYKSVGNDWLHLSQPWDILELNKKFNSGPGAVINGRVEQNVTIHGNVNVDRGTTLRSGAYIEGPVRIGTNCDIGPNCYIRPHTSIGNNVRVGNGVEVKNSVIMNGTKIGHLTYIGDSVIGRHCNFGAGTKVANLKLTNQTIRVFQDGKLVDTGLRKLGVLMGDHVKTGVNSIINPGTIVYPKATIQAGENVKGLVRC